MENEIEEWLLPGGFRPEVGDRVFMKGRWVTDCGHSDWHAELHPMELTTSQHEQARADAAGGIESVATIVITGEWNGEAIDVDLWPPARPSANAQLEVAVEPVDPTGNPDHPRGTGIIENVRVVTGGKLGGPNPNHWHYTFALRESIEPALRTGGRNNVTPDLHRRLAAKVHLWWR